MSYQRMSMVWQRIRTQLEAKINAYNETHLTHIALYRNLLCITTSCSRLFIHLPISQLFHEFLVQAYSTHIYEHLCYSFGAIVVNTARTNVSTAVLRFAEWFELNASGHRHDQGHIQTHLMSA
uniref:Uncharacterized protein n=1 Tax=Glossina austeni TaxID=7395 RepID=A0A1A9V3B4_GLOAU